MSPLHESRHKRLKSGMGEKRTLAFGPDGRKWPVTDRRLSGARRGKAAIGSSAPIMLMFWTASDESLDSVSRFQRSALLGTGRCDVLSFSLSCRSFREKRCVSRAYRPGFAPAIGLPKHDPKRAETCFQLVAYGKRLGPMASSNLTSSQPIIRNCEECLRWVER